VVGKKMRKHLEVWKVQEHLGVEVLEREEELVAGTQPAVSNQLVA